MQHCLLRDGAPSASQSEIHVLAPGTGSQQREFQLFPRSRNRTSLQNVPLFSRARSSRWIPRLANPAVTDQVPCFAERHMQVPASFWESMFGKARQKRMAYRNDDLPARCEAVRARTSRDVVQLWCLVIIRWLGSREQVRRLLWEVNRTSLRVQISENPRHE